MVRRANDIRDIRANAQDKETESSKMAKVYTTVKINAILEDIKKGKKPDLTPFYHGKKDLRDCNITFERTEEEEEEIRKCSMDILYFVSKYVKFRNDKGFTLVKLREYLEDSLHLLGDEIWDDELLDVRMKNRRVIFLLSRLTGKCCVADTNIQINNNDYNKIISNNKFKYSFKNYLKNKVNNYINLIKSFFKNI